MPNRKATLTRVVTFCLLCAIVLALFSGLTKNLHTEWRQHVFLVITIVITYGLAVIFTKWEKLPLKNVGIVPNKRTTGKIVIGFAIGLFMTLLQPAFVLLLGHFKLTLSSSIAWYPIIFYLSLYVLVAIREELAFRSFPLFSLYNRFGLWTSQLIILVIFSLEHVAGGMTWVQAFLGAGTGALLFGFAALKTDGIAFPAGMHAAWNFGQWCLGFKKETGLLQGIPEKGFENVAERNAWIGYLIIMAVAIVLFYFYKPKKNLMIPA
jgi:membrane protease YdiL (CAAX protease family)